MNKKEKIEKYRKWIEFLTLHSEGAWKDILNHLILDLTKGKYTHVELNYFGTFPHLSLGCKSHSTGRGINLKITINKTDIENDTNYINWYNNNM